MSHCLETFIKVATCQGKVRGKQIFLQVRELSGNFEKMSGNFVHLTNVREFCHDSSFLVAPAAQQSDLSSDYGIWVVVCLSACL